jgi:predicted anti-sigma-YlaC factor YlaD
MAMTHWLHIAMGRGRRLAAYATNELPSVVRDRVEADLLRCSACRREIEAYRLVSRTLQMSARAALAPEEAAAFWPGVETRIQRGAVGTSRPARPALRELFWDHPRLSLASAVAAVILVLGVTLGPMGLWGPSVVSNGVEVLSVEAGDDAPVMVFQAPGSKLKVIWVFEKPSPS